MANIWRRQPGTFLRGGRFLVRNRAVDASSQIANEFFEAAAAGGDATAFPPGVSAATAITAVIASGTALIAAAGLAATTALGAPVAHGAANPAPAGVAVAATLGQATASGGTSVNGTAIPAGVARSVAVGSPTAVGSATATSPGMATSSALGVPLASGTAVAVPPAGVGTETNVGSLDAMAPVPDLGFVASLLPPRPRLAPRVHATAHPVGGAVRARVGRPVVAVTAAILTPVPPRAVPSRPVADDDLLWVLGVDE